MKKQLFVILVWIVFKTDMHSQALTLVTGKRLWEHHSSTLSGQPYGYVNSNAQSGYDFVNHNNVASGNAALAANRDMLEHNGYFSWNGSSYGWKFGFTCHTTNIGTFNYQGNNLTTFYLTNAVSFNSLNTVNDLVNAYNAAAATKFDTAVITGNIYIVKVRNTGMYLAMRITNVSNLSAAQVNALDNNQQVTADVYFDFEYKYGSLCTAPVLSLSSSQSTICKGESVTLSAGGADTYTWSNGNTTAQITVSPSVTSTYSVAGTDQASGCSATLSIVQKVNACTGLSEMTFGEATLYPNPFSETLTVAAGEGVDVQLSGLAGDVLFSRKLENKELQINTAAYPPGIYLLVLRNGDKQYRRKLIKH